MPITTAHLGLSHIEVLLIAAVVALLWILLFGLRADSADRPAPAKHIEHRPRVTKKRRRLFRA